MSAAAGSDHVAVIILDRDVWHVLTMTVMDNGGIFVVSLDFELFWGVRYKRTMAPTGRISARPSTE